MIYCPSMKSQGPRLEEPLQVGPTARVNRNFSGTRDMGHGSRPVSWSYSWRCFSVAQDDSVAVFLWRLTAMIFDVFCSTRGLFQL